MSSVPLLVIIGAPGAGKSRVGKRVARMLGASFIDTDRKIVASHGPIPLLFREHGEASFRKIERRYVAEALNERAVVSLGGGAVLDADTQDTLASSRVALLTVSAEAVGNRISGAARPLLSQDSAERIESWQRLVSSRKQIYERLASKTWDTSNLPVDRIARELADWVTQELARENVN